MNKILNTLICASLLAIGWAEGSHGVVSEQLPEARFALQRVKNTIKFEWNKFSSPDFPDLLTDEEVELREAAKNLSRNTGGSADDWEKALREEYIPR